MAIAMGLKDPVRPFIKGEQHPSRKVNTPRLIMAISLVDQVVERLLFADYCDEEKSHYPNLGNMVGLGRGQHHDAAVLHKVKTISERLGFGPTASDVSGWERRVSPEMIEEIPLNLYDCAEGPDKEEWFRLAKLWAVLAPRSVYVIGDELYTSTEYGMMPSGTYMTSYGNGIMRLMYAFASGALEAMVLGDDCDEWTKDPEETMRLYNSWGLVTREYEKFPDDGTQVSFCSKLYVYTGEEQPLVVPQSWAKMVATYANLKTRTPAHYQQLCDELKGLPGPLYSEIVEWAKRVPIVLPPGVEQNESGSQA